MKAIYAVMNTSGAVVKIRPEKNSGLYGIWTYDLCDTGAVLYQLSWQVNLELVIIWFQINPWSGEYTTVYIWKSYIWTADKDVNMKAIFVVVLK